MKKNRRSGSSIKKERTIMLASSAFVLAALTMTGLYMKGQEVREQDDGYTLDFTAMENNTNGKLDEIAQNLREEETDLHIARSMPEREQTPVEDDLDYMPIEAGSHLVDIPGLTEQKEEPEALVKKQTVKPVREESVGTEEAEEEILPQEVVSQPVIAREFHFSEDKKLLRPVSGDVLIPYSMDGSVYFATLDQYKYNPATIFGAAEGTIVSACAEGQVVSIFDNEEIGHAVVVDIGDGYQTIYGQLTDIQVREGAYVDAGDQLGTVAAPTKYYVSDGANLYFKLQKDGQPVNAEVLF